MQHDIAIAVVAYNRPLSLARLMRSLEKADYSGLNNIPLYIHIDYSGDETVLGMARQFKWIHGSVHIHVHEQNVGLKKNVMSAAALSQQHEAVIVLEDDLIVSRTFYQYAQQAYPFFKDDTNIAGIALYSNTFNEVAYCTFDPIEDGYDNYFMQVPCSWGQLWTSSQWKSFMDFQVSDHLQFSNVVLPDSVASWPDDSSWKKQYYRYLIATDKYFVYPRVGLTTNFAESGKHITAAVSVFQTSLLLGSKKFQFNNWKDSFAIYDAYFEFSGIGFNRYTGRNLDVNFDINATKRMEHIHSQYIVTARDSEHAIETFATSCYPYENNVLLELNQQPGSTEKLVLTLTKDVLEVTNFNRKEADLRRCFISKDHAQSVIGMPESSLLHDIKSRIRNITRKK